MSSDTLQNGKRLATLGTPQQERTTLREWPEIGAKLGALVDFTSRLSHRYPSVDFDRPSALNLERISGEQATRWRSSDGAVVWLKTSERTFTVGVKLDPSKLSGRLLFWAVLDPTSTDNSLSGVMVTRAHEKTAVGKAVRSGEPRLSAKSFCIIVTADLNCVADRDFLSVLGKGFIEAATDQDRDAWVSWLWSQASQGHLKTSYVKSLAIKILGKHVREFTDSTRVHDSMDALTSLAKIGVFERGADYHLPSGLHAAAHVNLGIACGYPALIRELAIQVKHLIDEDDYSIIVTTGWPAAMIAREVIRIRPVTRMGVVRHSEYEGVEPLPLAPVREGGRAIILTDVIVTGQLVRRTQAAVEAAGTTVDGVIAIVDARESANHGDIKVKSVCHYDVQAVAPASCPRCIHLEPREFNPVACCMTSKKEKPRSPKEFLEENREAADFWKQVDIARAYEHHRMEGNTHYVSFIDTARLLTHETVGPIIVSKFIGKIRPLIGIPDVLVFPARARSRLLADQIRCGIMKKGRLWPPNMISVRQVEGRFEATAKDTQILKHAKVLLVDTAVASGATLEELRNLATSAGAASIAAAVIISRVSDSQEAAIRTSFEGRFLRLYQLPIRPLTIPDALKHLCPACDRRGEIERAASESGSGPIEELFKEMTSRRGHRSSIAALLRAETSRDKQLLLTAQAEVPLLEHCRRSTASGVTLHSLHAAMNNGMAPLRLPEICDEKIPATNRSAMLEYLGNTAWRWSSASLLPDAKRLLNERDPDEIWSACATFLNRGHCHYWIEALQHRLTVSGCARQLQSKTLWNRVAFEVYWLLKSEPSSLPEVSHRFESIYRTCVETPAGTGIAPILEIIREVARYEANKSSNRR